MAIFRMERRGTRCGRKERPPLTMEQRTEREFQHWCNILDTIKTGGQERGNGRPRLRSSHRRVTDFNSNARTAA